MSVASMPVTSPVARVQPPPPPRFNQAPLKSSVKNDNVAARAIKDSTPGSVTARVTTSDKLATRVNNVEKLSARGNRAECGSKGEVNNPFQPIKKPVRTLSIFQVYGVCEGCKGDFFQTQT